MHKSRNMGGQAAAHVLFPNPRMTQRPAKRLLILGWDAADWIMIRRLLDRGAMPNLRALMHGGSHADLATLEPKLSPLLWSTVATGKTADKHGILNFLEPDAQAQSLRVSSSTSRKTKALWNILTQAGLRTHAVSWYASHPAEPVQGTVVSNLFLESQPPKPADAWALPAGAVHPPEAADAVARARVHPGSMPAKALAGLVPQLAKVGRESPRIRTLARLVAQCRSVHAAAGAVLTASPDWDCAMVFHEAIDTIGHHFMQFHPPRMAHVSKKEFDLYRGVMDAVYAMHDAMLGDMLRLAGPDATVLLLSDHGFHSGDRRPVTEGMSNEDRAAAEASWHREYGVLVLKGPGVKADAAIRAPNLLDIAPTALALLGLPAGSDMDGRVLTEALTSPPPERIASWDESPGEAGMHPADLRQDPFEAQDAINQLIDLGYMAALPEDAQARIDLVRRESQFNLGVVLTTRDQPARAAETLAPLVADHPKEVRYAACLARSLLADLRPGEAGAVLRGALAHHPDHADLTPMLVNALGMMPGGTEEADEAWSLLRPRAEGAAASDAVWIADLCLLLGRTDEAERLYQRALDANKGDAAAMVGLARVETARGRFEPAAERCLDAVDIDPESPEAHHRLGVALAWLGEHEHAAASFRAATALQPGRIEAYRFLAGLLRLAGDGAGADASHRTADELLSARAPDPARRAVAEREDAHGPRAWAAHAGVPGPVPGATQ